MTNQFDANTQNEDASSTDARAQGKPSRRAFLMRSAAGAALAAPAASLLLTQTVSAASLSNCLSAHDAFHEIRKDEDAHVSFLKEALGSYARPMPKFKNLRQSSTHAFIQLSQVFENVGVGAYLMAAPAISSKGYLAAAGSILTIEARHAGYLNSLLGLPLSTNGSFDKPISQSEIVKDVMPFIASLNGGSDPSKPLKNDIDILNFALLLEFLEASFYDINVPKFY